MKIPTIIKGKLIIALSILSGFIGTILFEKYPKLSLIVADLALLAVVSVMFWVGWILATNPENKENRKK